MILGSSHERLAELERLPTMEFAMSVSDEERRDAEKTGELVSKKLFAIMDLRANIDAMLRDKHPTPIGSKNWHMALFTA